MQRLGEQTARETESRIRVPEVKVAAGPRRICPGQRHHRATDQQNPTGRFESGEFLKSSDKSLNWRRMVERRVSIHLGIRLLVFIRDHLLLLEDRFIGRVLVEITER